jgi:alanine racemase
VPLGYADGIPVSAGADCHRAGASVAVMKPRGSDTLHGYAPIVGTVSMDQCAIDLGELGGSVEVLLGRELEVLSPQHDGPTSMHSVAEACGITPHQLLVGIGPRVRRVAVTRPDVVAEQGDWVQAEAV